MTRKPVRRTFGRGVGRKRNASYHSYSEPFAITILAADGVPDWDDKTQFRYGGAEVFVGRPRVRLSCLDELACSELAIAPRISRRGPNGVWMINRGEQHALEQLFTDRFAYYVL
jgi:hypothetical protein